MSNKPKILITGGAGFIGANFVRKFFELGREIHVIEKPGCNFWRLKGIKDKIKIHDVSLKDCKGLENLILKIRPGIVLHFAAYGAYPKKQQDFKEMVDTNFIGTVNLVNACAKSKVKCFINTGSSSEYGIKNKPMKENDLTEPDNFYGITKLAATAYCQYMARKEGMPVVTMRPFAVYGYFEDKERLVPVIIKACLLRNKMALSSSKSVRDFIFIEDLISAYLLAIKNINKIKGEIFNVGTGQQASIGEVVSLVKKIIISDAKPEYGKIKKAQFEPKNWRADISKAKRKLGWKPKYNLEEGLRKNIKWFGENINLYK